MKDGGHTPYTAVDIGTLTDLISESDRAGDLIAPTYLPVEDIIVNDTGSHQYVLEATIPYQKRERDKAYLHLSASNGEHWWSATRAYQDDARSLQREIADGMVNDPLQSDGLTWDSFAGYEELKDDIKQSVVGPMVNPDAYAWAGIDTPGEILFYGPPGTGKTLMAKIISEETGATFQSVGADELVSKYVGESASNMRKLFDDIDEDDQTIMFFDEIDSIARDRDSKQSVEREDMLNTFLTAIAGYEDRSNVRIIGATNRPDVLDSALTRSGRFDNQFEFGKPTAASRRAIFEHYTDRDPALDKPDYTVPVADDFDYDALVVASDELVPADLETALKDAAEKNLAALAVDLADAPDKGMRLIDAKNPNHQEAITVTKADVLEQLGGIDAGNGENDDEDLRYVH